MINLDYNLTKGVTTRYYRAPENYMEYSGCYNTSLDMWSVGCILAELYTKAVFIRAQNTEEYLDCLIEFLGAPDEKVLSQIKNKSFVKCIQERASKIERKSLKELITNAPPKAIDLLEGLFKWDPEQRLTAKQVLEHPFLEELYNPDDGDIIEGSPVSYFDFEFEQYSMNCDIIKDLILDEIIMANSKTARKHMIDLKSANEGGVLLTIYD